VAHPIRGWCLHVEPRDTLAETDLGYFMTDNRGLDDTPPTVTDEMSAALLEDLGAPALVELTARIAGMNLTTRTNVALGISSQEFSAACGLQPLASFRRVSLPTTGAGREERRQRGAQQECPPHWLGCARLDTSGNARIASRAVWTARQPRRQVPAANALAVEPNFMLEIPGQPWRHVRK
jgi:hypothetical protein